MNHYLVANLWLQIVVPMTPWAVAVLFWMLSGSAE